MFMEFQPAVGPVYCARISLKKMYLKLIEQVKKKIAKGHIHQARTLLKLKYLKNDAENVLRLGWFNGRTLKDIKDIKKVV